MQKIIRTSFTFMFVESEDLRLKITKFDLISKQQAFLFII